MADNVTFQSATPATPPASTTVATDDLGGAHHQYVKIEIGADGTAHPVSYGTPMPIGTLSGGTVQTHGTAQVLGTMQPLAGSVHLASRLPGTVDVGTIAGTVSILGTTQPLAGSVHLASILPGGSVSAQGYVAHDAAAAGNPLLVGAFGSSGTQAAVGDGDAVRLWADPNGRLQVRGTIDSLPAVTGTVQTYGTSQVLGTVQVHGTAQVLGTVQTHGTSQALGTVQPLAGSVHLATNLAGGTVVSVGSAVHGAVADTRPHLISAFGSSGTQAAVDDGDAVRLWADLNGRLQVRGTIDSMPSITVASMPTTTVQATNLDIRDLTSASDSVAAVQSGNWTLAANSGVDIGDVTINNAGGASAVNIQDGGNSISVDDNGGSLTVDGSVSLAAALPAGTNNIGDVDVLTLPGSLQGYAEDAAHATGDTGVQALAVRTDSPANKSGTDGDYEPLQVSGGLLWTRTRGIQTPAGDSAMDDTNDALRVNVVAGGGTGGTSATDDSAFTVASGTGTPIMGLADETSPDSVDEGDVGVVRMTLARGLHVNIRDDAGDSAMDGANNAVRVNVVAGSSGGVTHTDDAAFTAGTDDGVPAFGFYNDTTPDSVNEGDAGALRMSSNRNLYVQLRDAAGNERGVNVDASNRLLVAATNTVTVAGTVQAHGTAEVLGTVQPLAGSVHLATNLAGGTVVSVGSAVHDAAADTRPHLIGAFGSSGTQAAVGDGDAVRLWADLNGRLQVRGTVDSLPSISGTVQTHGTSQALGTVQPLAGSVHLASILPGGSVSAQGYVAHDAAVAGNPLLMGAFGSSGTQAAVGDGDAVRLWADLNGRLQVRGTIDSLPSITGTVQTHGTSQALGTVSVAGTVGVGRVQGTVATRPVMASEGFFGSVFTAAVTNGTLVPAPGAGTFVRMWDVVVSGSAAGTAFLELGDGTPFGHVFTAAQGGFAFNSAKGVRTNAANQDILFNCGAGSWGVSINYSLETA